MPEPPWKPPMWLIALDFVGLALPGWAGDAVRLLLRGAGDAGHRRNRR